MLEKQVGELVAVGSNTEGRETGGTESFLDRAQAHTEENLCVSVSQTKAALPPLCLGATGQSAAGHPASCEQGCEQSCEQAAPRARVVCVPCSRTGLCKDSSRSRTTGAGARVREGQPPIRDKEAYFRAWRIAVFGGDIDPVRAAVDEAVREFSTHQPEDDRCLWLTVANAIGYEKFLDLFWEQKSIVDDCKRRGKPLRLPAAAFQKRLNRYTDHNMPEGGAE